MDRFLKILQQALRYLGYVVALVVLLLVVAIGFVGFTGPGARLAAAFIEDATAGSNIRVAVSEPSGLLTGRLRAGAITLADRDGVFAELRDVSVDWSPLDLLFLQFNAERISAGSLTVSRRPVAAAKQPSAPGKSFKLPVTAQVDSLEIPNITLAEAVAGKEQHLRLTGSGGFDRESIALQLALTDKDHAGTSAVADLAFNPGGNELRLNADISEPPGGMLTRALRIPGEPAVALHLTGDGPLSQWVGRFTASLDGNQVVELDARHELSPAGLHTVALKGGGTFEALLPPQLRPLFTGTTAIDVTAATDGASVLRIDRGLVTTAALELNAGGTLQTTGENDLNVRLTGTGKTPIPIRWPLAEGALAAELYGVQLVASGPAEATSVNVNINLASATVPQGRLESVLLTASSADLNLSTKSGHASVALTAERSAMSNPHLDRLVGTPLKIEGALAFSPEQVAFEPVTIESGSIGGRITGAYHIASAIGTASFQLFAVPGVLPDTVAAKVQGTIALDGQAAIRPGGVLLTDLTLKSNLAEATGAAELANGSLQAKLAGRLLDAGAFILGGSGEVAFDATASGPVDGPNVQAKVTSDRLALSGRTLDNLALDLQGKASATSPAGEFTLTAAMNGQAIDLRSSVRSDAGRIVVPTLEATVGKNRLRGALTLGDGFMPDGTIRFEFPELATLATLAGQNLTGDLAGTLTFRNTDGKGSLALTAQGTEISRDAAAILKPVLTAAVEDLRAVAVSGTLAADVLRVGENDLEAPVVAFTHSGNTTGLDVSGRFEDAPLALKGDVVRHEDATVIALRTLDAVVKGFPLALKEAASISIVGGDIRFDHLAVNAAGGIISVSGSANPAGRSSLAVNLSGVDGGPAEYRLPLAGGATALARIKTAQLTLSGELKAAALSLAATVQSAQTPQAALSDADIVVSSESFDLIERRGNLKLGAKLGMLDLMNGDANRLLQAPLNATAALSVTPERINFSDVALDGVAVNVKANGHFVREDASAGLKLEATAAASALPPALAARFGKPLRLTADLVRAPDGTVTAQSFDLASDAVAAKGTAKLAGQNLEASLSGTLPDLGKLLADASGRATFKATASGPLTALGVKAELQSSGAELAGRTLSDLVVTLDGTADRNAPSGNLTATGAIGGQAINVRSSIVSQDGTVSIPSIDARIGENVLTGALKLNADLLPDGTVTFNLPDIGLLAAMAGQQAKGDLAGSATIRTAGGKTAVSMQATGSGITRDQLRIVQPRIDLKTADLRALAISGSVQAEALASGANRLDALAVTFDQQGPRTAFDLTARHDGAPVAVNGSVEQQQGGMAIGLDTFEAAPRGIAVRLARPAVLTVRGGTVATDGVTIRAGSGTVAVSGTAGERLALAVRVDAVPASLANVVAAGLGAEGTIAGTVDVRGTAAAPQATYALTWNGAATSQTRAAGVGALTISADGRFADNAVSVQTRLSGPDGLAFRGGGTAGVAGAMQLDLTFSGTLPFALVQAPLGEQGFILSGNATVELAVRGPARAPTITGTVSTSGSRLVDVRRNLAIEDLAARVSLDGRQAVIQQLSGRVATGGRITATGTVGTAAGSNFPADLSIRLDNVTYVDGRLVNANIDGNLTVRGPLLAGPVLGGRINIRRANITIPQKLPGSLSEIDIKHRNAPPSVEAMAAALRGDEGGGGGGEARATGLDLQVDAPGRIFVRGRGVNAELGGRLTLRGTSLNPVVSGGFDLRRGRLEILAKRLVFTRGHIGFTGGLIPTINFVATSTAAATTINITIAGPANDPTVSFTSSPALPQDEILARLIFGRSMTNLSAFQIAQLAAAVSDLAGGGGGSLLEGLRSKLGIDDLDITTDSKGRAQVSAGKYLNERTYLELKQDPETGGGKAAINLDIGKGVKLRGEAGSDGGGAAGIFYEKEY